jgi:hypothetical protein
MAAALTSNAVTGLAATGHGAAVVQLAANHCFPSVAAAKPHWAPAVTTIAYQLMLLDCSEHTTDIGAVSLFAWPCVLVGE